jgi:O-methyltransferase
MADGSLSNAEIEAYGLHKLPAGSEPDYQAMMHVNAQKARWGDLEPAFTPIFEFCRAYTMTSVERMYALYKAVEYVVKADIPGALVECGVWKGGSMMLAAKTLLSLGVSDRMLSLYDTFEGHPMPDRAIDISIFGENAADEWKPNWARCDLRDVSDNMRSTGYPLNLIDLWRGRVEETLRFWDEVPLAPNPIAIARLDTDWYSSAKIELDVLWPKLSRGGVLILDDYGHYLGQRKAVDEYFADKPAVLMHRVDYSCRTIIKP